MITNDDTAVKAPEWIAPQATKPDTVPPKSKRPRRTRAQMAAARDISLPSEIPPPKNVSIEKAPAWPIVDALGPRKIRVRPFFQWRDLWVGIFVDTSNRAIYFCPLPMIGIKVTY